MREQERKTAEAALTAARNMGAGDIPAMEKALSDADKLVSDTRALVDSKQQQINEDRTKVADATLRASTDEQIETQARNNLNTARTNAEGPMQEYRQKLALVAKAGAEIIAIRKAVHAKGDDAKPLAVPIPANGITTVMADAKNLAESSKFQNMLNADGIAGLIVQGRGSSFEDRIVQDLSRKDIDTDISFVKGLTVNGRIAEICSSEAPKLEEKLRQAIAGKDEKGILAAKRDYLRMTAELIALDELAHSGSRDKKVPWDKVDDITSNIGSNLAYKAITSNLSDEVILLDLTRLHAAADNLDPEQVVNTMSVFERNHKPWKTVSERIKDDQRRIRSTEKFITETREAREEAITVYMNEQRVNELQARGRRSSEKQLRKNAEVRYAKSFYKKLATQSEEFISGMIAAIQLSGGDKSKLLRESDIVSLADDLETDSMFRAYLRSFVDDPKKLRDIALDGNGTALRKSLHDFLLTRPAGELLNSKYLSEFMPTYIERIEYLQKLSKDARSTFEGIRSAQRPAIRAGENALMQYCRGRNIPTGTEEERRAAEEVLLQRAAAAETEQGLIARNREATILNSLMTALENGSARVRMELEQSAGEFCRKYGIPFKTDEEKESAYDLIRNAAASYETKNALTQDERDALSARPAILAAREARTTIGNAERTYADVAVKTAAETVVLRNLAHAGRKQKSRLKGRIRADGVINLKNKTENLSGKEMFRAVMDDQHMRDLLEDGHGGEMYLAIRDRSIAKNNALETEYQNNVDQLDNDVLEPLEAQMRQLGDITSETKVNTVGGRLKEIKNTEARGLSNKMSEAIEEQNREDIEKLTDDYKKLLAEVLALNAAKERNGEDRDVDWKSVEGQVERRNTNQMFVNMTANLTPQKVMNDLTYLRNHTVEEFMTYQAENLNLANQAAQAGNAQEAVHYAPQIIAGGNGQQPNI